MGDYRRRLQRGFLRVNAALKRLLLATLTAKPFSGIWAPFKRGRGTIFMLHRFTDHDIGSTGHDPSLLSSALAYLRRERYELVSLTELFRRLGEATPRLDRAIAFTIDDGYLDQATVAGRIFTDFDCPVTTFVTTGFLDGTLWFWWDRIEYVLQHTARAALDVELDSLTLHYSRDPITGYSEAQADFTDRCKQVPDTEKLAGIGRLASAAEVDLPERPPLRYAPMSWEQVRTLERRGMRFGPHTVTHPILSRTTTDQSRREIEQSWARLKAEAAFPVPVFCYPNGQPEDYGDAEITVLQALGFAGAVVGTTGYAPRRDFTRAPDGPFRVRRFAYSDDLREFAQCATGLERVNQLVRGLA